MNVPAVLRLRYIEQLSEGLNERHTQGVFFFFCCLSDLPRILEKQKYDRETVPTIADERRRRSTCAEQRLDRGQHFEEAFHAYVTHARMR